MTLPPSPLTPRYSIVSDDRQSGYFDPGYNVRDDQTGLLMHEEPFQTMREAGAFLEELENPEGE